MTVYHNDPENFIDDSEYFFQYRSSILSGHKGNKLNPTTIKFITAQLDGESNSNVFTNITMFAYIRHVKCNVQFANVSKAPEKCFGLFIIKILKTNINISLWLSYYMPQNQHK